MTTDELITYGFKKVLEEMQKQTKVLERIEANTLSMNGEAIDAVKYLKQIDNASTIMQFSVLAMDHMMKEANNGGSEKK